MEIRWSIRKSRWQIKERRLLPAAVVLGQKYYCCHLHQESVAWCFTVTVERQSISLPLFPECCSCTGWALASFFLASRRIFRRQYGSERLKFLFRSLLRKAKGKLEVPSIDNFREIRLDFQREREANRCDLEAATARRRNASVFITRQRAKPLASCFETLGFTNVPARPELDRRFRELANRHHPDHNGDEREFKRVFDAYRVARALLLNPAGEPQ